MLLRHSMRIYSVVILLYNRSFSYITISNVCPPCSGAWNGACPRLWQVFSICLTTGHVMNWMWTHEWSMSEARRPSSLSWCHFRLEPFIQGTPDMQCFEAKEPEQPDHKTHWHFMGRKCKYPAHISSLLLSCRILRIRWWCSHMTREMKWSSINWAVTSDVYLVLVLESLGTCYVTGCYCLI